MFILIFYIALSKSLITNNRSVGHMHESNEDRKYSSIPYRHEGFYLIDELEMFMSRWNCFRVALLC